jgi:hypothetical protein
MVHLLIRNPLLTTTQMRRTKMPTLQYRLPLPRQTVVHMNHRLQRTLRWGRSHHLLHRQYPTHQRGCPRSVAARRMKRMSWASFRRINDEVRVRAQRDQLQAASCEGKRASPTAVPTTAAKQARLRSASRQPSRRVEIIEVGTTRVERATWRFHTWEGYRLFGHWRAQFRGLGGTELQVHCRLLLIHDTPTGISLLD